MRRSGRRKEAETGKDRERADRADRYLAMVLLIATALSSLVGFSAAAGPFLAALGQTAFLLFGAAFVMVAGLLWLEPKDENRARERAVPRSNRKRKRIMSEHVYGVTEVVGSSPQSFAEAVANAVETASGTLRNLEWFEVTQMRGHVKDGRVAHYQVMLKLGFRYERRS